MLLCALEQEAVFCLAPVVQAVTLGGELGRESSAA